MRTAARVGSLIVAVAALAACGSTTPSGPRGLDEQTRQQVEQCLQAAGIPVPTPGPRPTDRPTDRPRPTGAPGGRMYGDPEVRAALDACGITLPQRPDRTGMPPT
ncbi:hypothetical protein ACQEVB_34135 [Pseudonocardia sp. CA-107938]|uniref:hypothetical protein n=1 Tax=Pseudonocardia sp. CA-107938 TaxID=3240021 RepID=UPI003D8D348E